MPTHNWNVLFDAGGQWTARNTGGNWDVGGVFHLGHRLTGIYLNQFYATHVNALGSSTANTDSTGAEVGYKLFYPWGQRWLTQGTGGYEFSSFDFENPPSDLGQTLFRTYIPGYGRWLTPDPMGGDVTNPQSLNRYAYVTNNPASLTDPLGLDSSNPADPCSELGYYYSHAECGGPPPGSDCGQYDNGTCYGDPTAAPCIVLNIPCGGGGSSGGYGGIGSGGSAPGAPPAGQPPLAGGGSANWPLGCPFPYNSMGLCGLAPDLWTGQAGASASYTLPWGFSGHFFLGFAIDLHGHFAFYYGGGFGVGGGAGGSLGVQVGHSNAYTVCGLSGPFINSSGTFGVEGVGGTVDVFQGSGPGPGGTVTGGTVTVGAAGGAGASVTGTGTKVVPIHSTCPQG